MSGTMDADILAGTEDNDILEPLEGNDSVDGLGGEDTVILTGAIADYAIRYDPNTNMVTAANTEDVNTLTNVEVFEFDDATLELDVFQSGYNTIQANTYNASDQVNPSVAALTSGGYVSVWTDYTRDHRVYGQLFDSDDKRIGDEFHISQTFNTTYTTLPKVVGLQNGGFAVVFSGRVGNYDQSYLQLFDDKGAPTSQAIEIGNSLYRHNQYPDIAEQNDGNLIVAWYNSYRSEIYVQKFLEDGTPVGTEIASSNNSFGLSEPVIESFSDGGYIVAWIDNQTDGDGKGIYAQRFNSDGSKQDSLLSVNTSISGYQDICAIAHLSNDNVVISWTSDHTVYFQIIDSTGGFVGFETEVAGVEVSQLNSDVIATDNGFAVIWQEGDSIYAQRFDLDGNEFGSTILANNLTGNKPSGTLLKNGEVILAYQSSSANDEDNDTGISINRLVNNNLITLNQSIDTDTITGTDQDDVYQLVNNPVNIIEIENGGIDTVYIQINYELPNEVENLILLGDEALNAYGNNLDNYISGNAGDNKIYLLNGNDIVDGQAGYDEVIITASAADYSIHLVDDLGRVELSNTEETKILKNIEALEFDDATVNLDWFLDQGQQPSKINHSNVGDQHYPLIEALSDGSYVVVWQDVKELYNTNGLNFVHHIYAQRYSSEHQKVGNIIDVSTDFNYQTYQDNVSVDADNFGGFAIGYNVHISPTSNNNYHYSHLKIYGADNQQTNHISHQSTEFLDVSFLSDSSFVLLEKNLHSNKIYHKLYATNGDSLDENFILEGNGISKVIVEATSSGTMVIWAESGGDGSGYGIRAQKMGNNNNKVGSAIDINSFTIGDQSEPTVARINEQEFVVAWTSDKQDGYATGIFCQRIDEQGRKLGEELRVNSTLEGNQHGAHVTALEDGGFFITWTSETDVMGQRFDSLGNKIGIEQVLTMYSDGTQQHASIAQLADGKILVSYASNSSYDEDTRGMGVFTEVLDTIPFEISGLEVFGDIHAESLVGSQLNDKIIGSEGDDFLDGAEGIDQLVGGMGDDIYVVDHVEDVVIEYAIEGEDTVRTSVDYELADTLENIQLLGASDLNADGNQFDNVMHGNAGNNLMTAIAGNDMLFGNEGQDELFGGEGEDFLDGGLGSDRMYGGLGDDKYVVDNANDLVLEYQQQGIDTVYSSIDFRLTMTLENLVLTGNENLQGHGNSKDNIIQGNAGNNILIGEGGSDLIEGGFGDDSLYGNGDDELFGDAGNDQLFGEGSIKMHGGYGNDVIQASGTGSLVTGGLDSDLFIYDQAYGEHIITDFSYGDSIQLSNLTEINSYSDFHGGISLDGQVSYSTDGADSLLFIGLDDTSGVDLVIRLQNYLQVDSLKTQSNTLVTNIRPEITTHALSDAVVGETYEFTLKAEDDIQGNLTYQAVYLPDWAQLDSRTGIILGTPSADALGNHQMTIRVTDGFGASAEKQIDLRVVAELAQAEQITQGSLKFGIDNQNLSNLTMHIDNQSGTSSSAVIDSKGEFAITAEAFNGTAKVSMAKEVFDDAINISDLVAVLQSSVGLLDLSASQKIAGDLNGDGLVNTIDAVGILRHIVDIESITNAKVVEVDDLIDHALSVDDLKVVDGVLSFNILADYSSLVNDTGISSIMGTQFQITVVDSVGIEQTVNWHSALTTNGYQNANNSGNIALGSASAIVDATHMEETLGSISIQAPIGGEVFNIAISGVVTEVVGGSENERLVNQTFHVDTNGMVADLIDFSDQNVDLALVLTGDVTESLTDLLPIEIV